MITFDKYAKVPNFAETSLISDAPGKRTPFFNR
jgi:hypothetical protein